MRKMLLLVICAMTIIMTSHPSRAQQLIESYQAVLSERDHFNSNGQWLTSAAAIIRQDRANFHRYGFRDAADEDDKFFADEVIEQPSRDCLSMVEPIQGLSLVL